MSQAQIKEVKCSVCLKVFFNLLYLAVCFLDSHTTRAADEALQCQTVQNRASHTLNLRKLDWLN